MPAPPLLLPLFLLLLYPNGYWFEASPSSGSSYCPLNCSCDRQQLRVVCHQAGLSIIPLTFPPELRELSLSGNHLLAIRGSFNVYRKLRFVDLSQNRMESIGLENFLHQNALLTLLLNGNLITNIHNETFRGLNSLQILQLNHNQLTELSPNTFRPLSGLETLDLSSNRLTSISNEAFSGLIRLKDLSLRENRLSQVPSPALNQHLPTLVHLDLGFNALSNIPQAAFYELEELETLHLDNCGIASLTSLSFEGLMSLLKIKLEGNELEEIPSLALKMGPSSLEEIDLGGNRFTQISPDAFEGLKFLKKVNISDSPTLACVKMDAFSSNFNLETLFLEHNRELRLIEPGAFPANLNHVSLRGNALETLEKDLLAWDILKSFSVVDNPLTCNCSLLFLWTLMKERNSSYYSQDELNFNLTQATCARPFHLQGQILGTIQKEDLDCGMGSYQQQLVLGAIVGSLLVLALLVFLTFKFRVKLAGVLKKTNWKRNRKEQSTHYYQKTQNGGEEESNILRAAAQHPLKNTPVTEL